ncbi:XPG I-region-domain-containing protein [Suillus americanus]|nr:XPG I-region-domain-containing protein [Suillus americanus]
MALDAYQTKATRLGAAPTGSLVTSSACWTYLVFTGLKYVLSPHDVSVSPVPYQAPSKAEAELAAMNVHGVIDTVMTEDSDILIFGAPCIIRSAKNDKDYLNVQVFMEDGIEHGCSLTQGDRLLIALLVGGDYDGGVPGCGIEIAHKAALHSKIGQMLLDAFLSMMPDEFSQRAKELVEDLHTLLSTNPYNLLERRYKAVADRIPQDFPRHAVVSKYIPTFMSSSTSAAASSWDISFYQPDLANLADFCRQHLGWEDDAIIEKMYGGIWEGAYLCALCKVSCTVFTGSH